LPIAHAIPFRHEQRWVETEIAKARRREGREQRRVLFPISLVPSDQIQAKADERSRREKVAKTGSVHRGAAGASDRGSAWRHRKGSKRHGRMKKGLPKTKSFVLW